MAAWRKVLETGQILANAFFFFIASQYLSVKDLLAPEDRGWFS